MQFIEDYMGILFIIFGLLFWVVMYNIDPSVADCTRFMGEFVVELWNQWVWFL